MKKAVLIMLILAVLFSTTALALKTTVVMFHGAGCPHCEKMDEFLVELESRYPDLEVKSLEVYFNDRNHDIFKELSMMFNKTIQGVPTLFIDSVVIIGFDDSMRPQIESMIATCVTDGCPSPLDRLSPESRAMVANASRSGVISNRDLGGIGAYVCVFVVLVLLVSVSVIIFISRRKT
jgi:glutaredoxin